MDSENNKFLLHDDQLEVTVLASLVWLCREGNFDAFFNSQLSKEHFYNSVNATIFETIGKLCESSTIPNQITITERIMKDGYTNVEPVEVVTRTEFQIGMECNFFEHVRILKELALRRKGETLSQLIAKGCKDPTVDIAELISKVDDLKEEAEAMIVNTFEQYYHGANKDRIQSLLIARGQNISTGYHFGSEELTIPPKALTFIVGATGHCKSTFLMNLALRVCKLYPKKKVLYLSYEEAIDSVYVNMLNIYAKVDLGNHNRDIIANHTIANGDLSKLPKTEKQEFDDYKQFLQNKQAMVEFAQQEKDFYKMVDDGRLNIQYVDFPVDTLGSFIMDMRRKDLCDIAFVDYIQLLNAPVRSKYHSREDEMKEICIDLKNLAIDEDYGLPIVFGAQFNRQVKSARDLLPTNIGEAGDIERIANTIVALWNCMKTEDQGSEEKNDEMAKYQGTKEYNESAIFAKILKRRGYASGFTGTFPYEGNTGRILDRGDATTKEINVSQQELDFDKSNKASHTYVPF